MSEGNGGQIARATVIDVPMSGQRSLATVTAEIRAYQDAARRMALSYSIEIGRRLVEAKDMVAHGEWQSYLRDELGFSQSTANNHMRLFEAYGAEQMTLDGAALKSQAFASLSYTQALELLALPSEEERVAFAETHDLTAMGTRELREELRRRGEDPAEDAQKAETAQKALEAMKALRKQDAERIKQIEEQADIANSARDEALKAQDAAQKAAAEAERKAQAAAAEMKKAKDELKAARDAEDEELKKLKAAEKDKTVPPETIEKLRKEAEAASEKAYKEQAEKLDQARQEAAKAREEAEKAKQEAKAQADRLAELQAGKEALEKELQMASPAVAVFRDRFASLQADLGALITSIDELPEDKQAGARKGLRTILQNMLAMVQEPEEVQA